LVLVFRQSFENRSMKVRDFHVHLIVKKKNAKRHCLKTFHDKRA